MWTRSTIQGKIELLDDNLMTNDKWKNLVKDQGIERHCKLNYNSHSIYYKDISSD